MCIDFWDRVTILQDCNYMKLFIFTYFQELRGPPTISGIQAGKVTAATWQWYGAMDAALQGQQCLSLPLLRVTNGTSTADGVVSTLALAPSVEEVKGKGKIQNGRETVLGQLGIPKCISPQPASAATMVESTEMKPHNCKLHFQNITVVLVQNGFLLWIKINDVFFFFF